MYIYEYTYVSESESVSIRYTYTRDVGLVEYFLNIVCLYIYISESIALRYTYGHDVGLVVYVHMVSLYILLALIAGGNALGLAVHESGTYIVISIIRIYINRVRTLSCQDVCLGFFIFV